MTTALAAGTATAKPMGDPATTAAATFAANRSLGRGVSFGNALDAPQEGDWGVVIEDDWFDLVAEVGFDSVRVPIRWSAHARARPPYTIDEAFFERVDHVVAQARRVGLPIVLDVHHYDALMDDPATHGPRFVALWRQIAARYADEPHTVLFELLNEPSGAFDDEPTLWNDLIAAALKAVRRTNPRRPVIVGPVERNGIGRLDDLVLPADPSLIVSVHFYAPLDFTHQGAAFVKPTPPIGVEWWPDQPLLEDGVENWSWDAPLRAGREALMVDFVRRHGGFSLRLPRPLDPIYLRARVRGVIELAAGCTSDGELDWVARFARSADEWVDVRAELEACPADTRRIGLMNRRSGAASLELAGLELCGTEGCRSLLVRADDAMRREFDRARAWGAEHGRPMHLGEFGVHRAADRDSRARWTAEVQRIASEAGMSSAYWALGTKFGIYEPSRGWDERLLDALLR